MGLVPAPAREPSSTESAESDSESSSEGCRAADWWWDPASQAENERMEVCVWDLDLAACLRRVRGATKPPLQLVHGQGTRAGGMWWRALVASVSDSDRTDEI